MNNTIEDIEQTQKNEIIEAIKRDTLYDFIASNYYRIEDDIIIQLLKESIYILSTCTIYEENLKRLIDNLKEYQGW